MRWGSISEMAIFRSAAANASANQIGMPREGLAQIAAT